MKTFRILALTGGLIFAGAAGAETAAFSTPPLVSAERMAAVAGGLVEQGQALTRAMTAWRAVHPDGVPHWLRNGGPTIDPAVPVAGATRWHWAWTDTGDSAVLRLNDSVQARQICLSVASAGAPGIGCFPDGGRDGGYTIFAR